MLKTTAIRSVRAFEFSRLPSTLRTHTKHVSDIARPSSSSRHARIIAVARSFSTNQPRCLPAPSVEPTPKPSLQENIYTIPNLLTVSRIISCPVLGWSILSGDYHMATGLLVYAGLTDLADGWIARRFNMSSVVGTILDPAADKALMTTLTVTLAMQDLIPTPLAVIILGRDALLVLSAFYIRYKTLPQPKTFARYWDFSLPSAEVRPTTISKANTALQLLLMGTTTITPILPIDIGLPLQGLQWLVATTTIWSGMSYLISKDAVRVIKSTKSNNMRPPS